MRNRVEVRTGCRVSRIETNDERMATGAWYFDANGEEVFQPAEIVILACNGIGTPRILLNSVSERFPNGLANSRGQVGRNLMFHPYALVRGRFDEPLDGYRGSRGFMWSMEFYETDPARDFMRGYCYQFTRGFGPVMTSVNGMADGLIPWGEGHHAAFRKLFDHQAGMVSICEDLPEEINRVTLDPALKDGNGIAAPKITYRIGENTRKMLDHSLARGTEILSKAGASDIVTRSPLSYAGWHLLGTARMGTDPRTSVVNEWGRSHDVKNLFIIDGSVFVTSGASIRRRPSRRPPSTSPTKSRRESMTSSTDTAIPASIDDERLARLSPAEQACLACLAGHMIPPSEEFAMPGADDPAIWPAP